MPAGQVRLAGNLFQTQATDDDSTAPAIVVSGAWTVTAPGTADMYALRLARRGLMALSFDFTGFGLSGGEPRGIESPGLKARDIRYAISYLAEHPAVDPDRLGVLAVCASAGSAVVTAVNDPRVKSLSLIAPWLHDAELILKAYGARQGDETRSTASSAHSSMSAGTAIANYVPDGRVVEPRSAVEAWTEWLRFDPIALASQIHIPTLVVHSNEGAVGARRFNDALTGPKQLVWLPGAQSDFYAHIPTIDLAVDHAVRHFEHHLQPER